MRIEENSLSNNLIVQVCDKVGKVEASVEKMENTKEDVFDNTEAPFTIKFSALINKYAEKGYKLNFMESNSNNGTAFFTTLIFEK